MFSNSTQITKTKEDFTARIASPCPRVSLWMSDFKKNNAKCFLIHAIFECSSAIIWPSINKWLKNFFYDSTQEFFNKRMNDRGARLPMEKKNCGRGAFRLAIHDVTEKAFKRRSSFRCSEDSNPARLDLL